MKSKIHPRFALYLAIGSFALTSESFAAPETFLEGIQFDSSWNSFLVPWTSGSGTSFRSNLEFSTYNGGLVLYSGRDESSPGMLDGGVTLYASPISMVLGSSTSAPDQATFDIWRSTHWSPTKQPLFRVDGLSGDSIFTGSAVKINGGSLNIDGNPVLTSSNAGGVLANQGFLQLSNLASALDSVAPPTSAAWQAAYVPRGNTTNGASIALGSSSSASAPYAVAIGDTCSAGGQFSSATGYGSNATGDYSAARGSGANATGGYSSATGIGVSASGAYATASGYNSSASAAYSSAIGYNSTATTLYSHARGNTANASGFAAIAMGWGASARSRCETAVGNYNLESAPLNMISISGLDGAFRVGNGTSSSNRSDALTVLKSGETTLTNKDWKAATLANPGNPSTALSDPASSTDSGGNALVVDGHAILNGKVILSVPQGDISMGIYQ